MANIFSQSSWAIFLQLIFSKTLYTKIIPLKLFFNSILILPQCICMNNSILLKKIFYSIFEKTLFSSVPIWAIPNGLEVYKKQKIHIYLYKKYEYLRYEINACLFIRFLLILFFSIGIFLYSDFYFFLFFHLMLIHYGIDNRLFNWIKNSIK